MFMCEPVTCFGTKMNIAVLGGGTIGSAVAMALNRNGYCVTVTRRSPDKLDSLKMLGINTTSDNNLAAADADIIILVLKPQDVLGLLKEISGYTAGKIVISLAAALKIAKIRDIIPEAKVVRAMTNVAARVGGGYTVYSTDSLSEDEHRKVSALLGCFGAAEKIEERYMDALTAMSGSGPAYIFTIIESMVYAGLKVGLPRELALRSSYETILGSAKLVAEGNSTVSELRDLVTTPGGVTIDALYELENAGIKTAFMRAIEAATNKARRISDNIDAIK